jgi:hypothetical protein
MRKSMNLKALMVGPLNENVSLGDEVEVGREDEDKRDGVVKVPNGPGNTTGVLIDGELEMVPEDEIKRARTDESCHHTGAVACADGKPISANPFKRGTDDYDGWESGWREEAAQERAAKRADYADDYGDEAADDYMRESEEDVLEEGVLGMTSMPSLARMQQLAGIKVTESFPFAKDDEESDDDQAEEAEESEADDADETSEEGEADETSEEGEADEVEDEIDQTAVDAIAIAVAPEAVEREIEAIEDQTDAIEAATDELPAVAANHPATAGEVQMMSSPVEAEDFPETEEAAPEPEALEVCMKAIGDLEQQLPNISVKDFADISKRLNAIQSSLFEGYTGRLPKR